MTATTTPRQTELAELVREHQADLWRYLRFLGCGAGEAEDLVQETFLAVWQRPPQYRSAAETAGYLRQVARNKFLAARRRQNSRPTEVDLEAAEMVWGAAVGPCGMDRFLSALEDCLETALGRRARRAIDLKYRDRLGRPEIAEALELTVEGVKTLLRRARSTLRECVERKVQP